MRIVEDYFARLKPRYETGEEALAETAFGFQKSATEFIQICIHSLRQISLDYEGVGHKKVLFYRFRGLIQKELTLRSSDELKLAVTAFFDMDSASFQAYVCRK